MFFPFPSSTILRATAVSWLCGLLLSACGEEGATARRGGVVSLAPNLTETVCALGKQEMLTGISDYDDYPPAVLGLPRMGGYLDPNFEKLTLLRPELLLLPGRHPKVTEFAAQNNIPVLNIDMDSMASILEGIVTLGDALDVKAEAHVLKEQIEGDMQKLRQRTANLPHPKVLIITTRQPREMNTLYTAGADSFVSEVVTLAGGNGIYANASQRYLEASKETVVMEAPEVILEFHCGEELTLAQQDALIEDWNALPSLPAVRDRRIFIITESYALRPGPRIIEVAQLIAGLLHPDQLPPP